MLTFQKRQSGSGAGSFVKFLVAVTLFFVLLAPGLRCAQDLPGLAGRAAASVATSVIGGIGQAIGDALDAAWDAVTDPIAKWWDNIKRFWDSLDPAERLTVLCKLLPKGVSDYCDMAGASLEGDTEANRKRVACLNGKALDQGGREVVLKVNETCVKYKNNRSELESCLTRELPLYGVDVSDCLAGAPGQLGKQMQEAIKPLACPPNVPGTICDMKEDPEYVHHPKYLQCLSDMAYRYNGSVRAEGCAVFNNPPNPVYPQKWDACMVHAIKKGLGEKDGGLLVRQCMNTERPWWDPMGWFINVWF